MLRIIYATSPHWADVLSDCDRMIAGPRFTAVKSEPKTTAGFLTTATGETVFLKRFEVQSWVRGLGERVRGSRALRSLRNAALLREHGFSSPMSLAAAELRQWGEVRLSYLVCEALTNARTMSAFLDPRFDTTRREIRWRRKTLAAVAREVRRLHDAGLYPSDLQETNLMLEEHGDQLKVYFVDLDRFRHIARVSDHRRERNLVQLDRSVGRFLRATERLSFLYAYLGKRPSRPKLRAVIKRLMEQRQSKELEYERRRARRALRTSEEAQR